MFKTDTTFKTKLKSSFLGFLFLWTLPTFAADAKHQASTFIAGITGTAFLDCNGNGIKDVGEVGFDGITVMLDGSSNAGGNLQTTITKNGGVYNFAGVTAGNYKITFKFPSGTFALSFSPQNKGNDPLLNSDVDATGSTTLVVVDGKDLNGINAGIVDKTEPKMLLVNSLIAGLNNGDTLTVSCENVPQMNNSWASAADNSGLKSDPIFSDSILASGHCATDGFTQLLSCTWTAKDICGNTSVISIFIKVIDNKAPVIINTPLDTIIYTFKGEVVPSLPNNISASDNCSGNNIGIQYAETQKPTGCGSITKRTWTSSDVCGNSTTQSQSVTIVATQGCTPTPTNPIDSFTVKLAAGTSKDTLVSDMFGTNRIVTSIARFNVANNNGVSGMLTNGGTSVRFSATSNFTKTDTIVGTQCGNTTAVCRDFFIIVTPQALQTSAHCFLPNDTSANYKVATCNDKAYFCIAGVNNVDSFKHNYTILEGGQPYTNTISGCSFDSLYSYTYFTIPKMGQGAPYRLDYWNLNGHPYTISNFTLIGQLLDSMNVWDPIGKWKVDTSLLVIYGGNSRNSYGQIKVTRIANGSIGYLEVNTQYNSHGLNICFNVGGHELIIRNNATNCQDLVRVVVTCDALAAKRPVAVFDTFTVRRNGSKYFSPLANDELNGALRSFSILRLPKNGNFTYIGADSILYIPTKNFCGRDTMSYSVCNEFFLCDTSTINVTVTCDSLPKKPVAVSDIYTTKKNTQITFNPTTNDQINGTLSGVNVVTSPKHGAITFSGVNSLVYTPDVNFCGGIDTLRYRIVNTDLLADTAFVFITVTCDTSGIKPKANNDNATTNKNVAANINVLTNDVLNGTLVSLTVNKNPNHGTASILNNTVVYTPSLNFCGANDTLQYKICNGTACDSAFIFVTVVCDTPAIPKKPKAVNDSYTTSKNKSVVFKPTLNDQVNGVLSGLSTVSLPSHGDIGYMGIDTLIYSPRINYCGLDTFRYRVCNTDLQCDTAFVFITVTCDTTLKPVAVADVATTKKNTPVKVNVLLNDAPNGTPTVTIAQNPKNGTAVVNNNQVVYTPSTGFCGANDTLRYKLCNSNGCDSALVIVTVTCDTNPVGQKPIAIADGASTKKNTPVTVDVLANDFPYGTVTVSINQNPKNGTAVVTNSQVVYTPSNNFCGANDTLRYKICNAVGCDSALLIVAVSCGDTINPNKPVAVNDSYTTKKNKSITFKPTTNDNLNGTLSGLNIIGSPKHGTVNFMGTDSLIYQPTTDFCGIDTIKYRVANDKLLADSAFIFITVSCDTTSPVNLKPIAVADVATTKKNTPVTVNILSNDTPNGTVTVSIYQNPKNGTAVVTGVGLASTIVYIPTPGFCGARDTLRYQICNSNGCDSALVVVNVTCDTPPPTPKKPIAVNDSYTTKQGVIIGFKPTNNDNINGTLAGVNIVSPPKHGSIGFFGIDSLIYKPDSGYCGKTDTLKYRVSNTDLLSDTAFIFITVTCDTTPTSLKPIAKSDVATTKKNMPTTINVLANDTPNGTVTVTVVVSPKNGTAFVNNNQLVYTPKTDFCGKDTLRYNVCNTVGCDSATVIVTVTCDTIVQPTNKKPIAITDYYVTKKNVTINFSPITNDILNGTLLGVSISKPSKHGSIGFGSTSDSLIYAPNRDYCGNDTLQYLVCNNSNLCDTANIYIKINCTDTLKPIAANDAYVTFKNKSIGIKPLTNDILNGALAGLSTVSTPKHGAIAFVGTDSITYSPNLNYCGLDTFQYKVCNDKNLCDSAFVFITVNCDTITPTPKKPVAVNDTVNTKINKPVRFKPTANDNINGTLAGMSVVKAPTHGTIGFIGTDSMLYVPTTGYCGKDTMTYRITNTDLLSDTAFVYFNIACDTTLLLPFANADSVTTRKNTPIRILILNNDILNGTLDSIKIISSPILGTATLGSDNIITYTPDSCGFTDSLKYRICNKNGCSIAVVKIRVLCDTINPTQAPLANIDSATMNKGVALLINVIANDSVRGSDTFRIKSNPKHAIVAFDSLHRVKYQSTDTIFCGRDTFTYEICNRLGCSSAPVYVNISCSTLGNRDSFPRAKNDMVTTFVNKSIDIPVLNNDTLRGGTLQPSPTVVPKNGLAMANGLGGFTYVPNKNYFGIDSFQYAICNRFGCDTAWVFITVDEGDSIVVFNAISPNGDQSNEMLHIAGIDKFPDNQVVVLNRWGTEVYNVKGYTNANGWDGSWRHKMLPDGTYFYYLIVNKPDNTQQRYTGYLQIHR